MATRLLSARSRKPRRGIPVLLREFGFKSDRKKEQQKAQKEQAEAARNLAASAVTNNVAQGLKWYREATSLDPDNLAGWLGFGDAAMLAGMLREADQGFLKYLELARMAGN